MLIDLTYSVMQEHFVEIQKAVVEYCNSDGLNLSPSQVFGTILNAMQDGIALGKINEEKELVGFGVASFIQFKGRSGVLVHHVFAPGGGTEYKEGFEEIQRRALEAGAEVLTCESPIGKRWDIYAKRWLKPRGFFPVATVYMKELNHG